MPIESRYHSNQDFNKKFEAIIVSKCLVAARTTLTPGAIAVEGESRPKCLVLRPPELQTQAGQHVPPQHDITDFDTIANMSKCLLAARTTLTAQAKFGF